MEIRIQPKETTVERERERYTMDQNYYLCGSIPSRDIKRGLVSYRDITSKTMGMEFSPIPNAGKDV